MKNMFALMFVCATLITSCSTNESTTTETTTELVDTLYQDTIGQVENVDTTVNIIQ